MNNCSYVIIIVRECQEENKKIGGDAAKLKSAAVSFPER
jgi:hypothetical protein